MAPGAVDSPVAGAVAGPAPCAPYQGDADRDTGKEALR